MRHYPKVGTKFANKVPETVFAALDPDDDPNDVNVRKISSLTTEMLPLMPETDPLRGRIYESCAVVGNSGLMMVYDDGAVIDSHDAVIRFNAAPTKPR